MNEPEFLVKAEDGNIYAYWRRDILLCDIATNRGEQITIYRKVKHGFSTKYEPVSVSDLRNQKN